jgi:transposase
MRFEEVYGRLQRRRLSCEAAAEVLGVSVSTFYRYRQRFEAEGADGLYDRRLGKVSGRRAATDEVMSVLALYETRYFDFTVKHFHEKLPEHGVGRSYSWTKNVLQGAGKVAKAKRRGAHRRKRARRPMVGMMLHQDGSKHEWVPGQWWDLIVTMDDADNELYSGFFVEEEGTMSSFGALAEVIEEHGLFGALYADRASHYWHTKKEGGAVDKDNPTQVHRALQQLGIELIPAYSPEARGRSERMFGTLQKRLPQELRLHGITDMAAANRFLAEVYLPEHNRRFRAAPSAAESAFVPYRGRPPADILCVQEERVVGNDNTVRYNGRCLQIPPDRHRHHYVKIKVRVHEYPDGTFAVFHGPRCLARYETGGTLCLERDRAAA